jgi:hypothetical protein
MPVSKGIMRVLEGNGDQREPAVVPRLLPPAHIAQDVIAHRDGLHLALIAPFAVARDKIKSKALGPGTEGSPSRMPVIRFTILRLAARLALVDDLLLAIGGQLPRPARKKVSPLQALQTRVPQLSLLTESAVRVPHSGRLPQLPFRSFCLSKEVVDLKPYLVPLRRCCPSTVQLDPEKICARKASPLLIVELGAAPLHHRVQLDVQRSNYDLDVAAIPPA